MSELREWLSFTFGGRGSTPEEAMQDAGARYAEWLTPQMGAIPGSWSRDPTIYEDAEGRPVVREYPATLVQTGDVGASAWVSILLVLAYMRLPTRAVGADS